jgi:hypothetical protein
MKQAQWKSWCRRFPFLAQMKVKPENIRQIRLSDGKKELLAHVGRIVSRRLWAATWDDLLGGHVFYAVWGDPPKAFRLESAATRYVDGAAQDSLDKYNRVFRKAKPLGQQMFHLGIVRPSHLVREAYPMRTLPAGLDRSSQANLTIYTLCPKRVARYFDHLTELAIERYARTGSIS